MIKLENKLTKNVREVVAASLNTDTAFEPAVNDFVNNYDYSYIYNTTIDIHIGFDLDKEIFVVRKINSDNIYSYSANVDTVREDQEYYFRMDLPINSGTKLHKAIRAKDKDVIKEEFKRSMKRLVKQKIIELNKAEMATFNSEQIISYLLKGFIDESYLQHIPEDEKINRMVGDKLINTRRFPEITRRTVLLRLKPSGVSSVQDKSFYYEMYLQEILNLAQEQVDGVKFRGAVHNRILTNFKNMYELYLDEEFNFTEESLEYLKQILVLFTKTLETEYLVDIRDVVSIIAKFPEMSDFIKENFVYVTSIAFKNSGISALVDEIYIDSTNFVTSANFITFDELVEANSRSKKVYVPTGTIELATQFLNIKQQLFALNNKDFITKQQDSMDNYFEAFNKFIGIAIEKDYNYNSNCVLVKKND